MSSLTTTQKITNRVKITVPYSLINLCQKSSWGSGGVPPPFCQSPAFTNLNSWQRIKKEMQKVFETAIPQVLNLFPGNRWMLLELKPSSTTAPDLHSCSYLYLKDKYVILSLFCYTDHSFHISTPHSQPSMPLTIIKVGETCVSGWGQFVSSA